MQGKIIGKMEALGFELQKEAFFETFTIDVLKTSEIEGQILNPRQVRSSVARRLGIEISGLTPADRHIDGLVEMMMDATQNYNKPLTAKRLFDWHSALFPTARSGMRKIKTGEWRSGAKGAMQVVSGVAGKEKIHFIAPDAKQVKPMMNDFLKWFNSNEPCDLVLKAALAHLWFLTIHPFEDGNGRIARSVSDMLLAKSEGISRRFYSMSARIRTERKQYYNILEKTQKGNTDITEWLLWFLNCLLNALAASEKILANVFYKHNFWNRHSAIVFNDRQVLFLNKLLEGFSGKLTSTKWAKITKCSADTALRDINDLINKKILQKDIAGGRSTGYKLAGK